MSGVWFRWFVDELTKRFPNKRGWFTAGQVARELSISTVTAKKWLLFLVEEKKIHYKQEAGKNGVVVHYFKAKVVKNVDGGQS